MNITLMITLLLLVSFCLRGYRRGMTKEISGLIAWAVTLFVISLIIMLYSSLRTNETRNTIYSVIILVLIGFVYGIVRFVLKSVKLLSKLPVFHLLDRILGLAVGLGEGVLIVWLVYVLAGAGFFGGLGSVIYQDTANSTILFWLYKYNYLAKIIAAL